MKLIKQQYNNIIRFFKLMIPNKRKFIVISFAAALPGVFFGLASANILKAVYSAVVSENSTLIFKNLTLFVLMLAGTFFYNYIFWKLCSSTLSLITGGIRRTIISKLCSLRLLDMEDNHSAQTMSVLTNDLEAAQGIYENVRLYVASVMVTIIPTVLVFNISSLLALLIILMGVMQLIINLLVIKPLELQSIKIREQMSAINSTYVDVLQNNMAVRLYCSESFYSKVCSDINKSLFFSKMKLNSINAFTEGINVAFGLLGYIILLIVGSALIGVGKLSLPNLLFITQMRLMMIQGILAFGNYAVQIQPAAVGISKILTLMDYDVEEGI
jgi:ABC-type multidrug transport system fused ATPase/permease subunit